MCHFYKLRNDQRPYYFYSEIPQERNLHYNLRRPNVYEPNVISTNRFSHTYFQNSMREWNPLDETIKNSPTISVFKRELVRLVRLSKKSYFGIHDIEGIRLLSRLQVHLATFANIEINFNALVPCAFVKLGLRTMNTSSCTAHTTVIIGKTSLTVSRMLLT